MVQNRISTGMHHLVHSYVDIYKRKEMESIKDDLVHLYASSRKRFTKISDEKNNDLWHEEEAWKWDD